MTPEQFIATFRPHAYELELSDKMTIEEFTAAVKDGLFTDYDGSGFYGTDTQYFWNLPAIPSLFQRGLIWNGFTHVAWFNK